MLVRKTLRLLTLGAVALSFSAVIVAADKPTNPNVAQETIKQRQENFKQIGGAFKTIRDETRSRNSDLDAIAKSAATINTLANDLPSWFPAGTGAEAGIETEALAVIWKDQAGFAAAAKKLADASADFLALTDSRNASKIGAGIPALGGSCKNCHDNYRED